MFTLLLHLQLAQAEEIYKWVDEKGTVHFTDYRPGTIKSSVEPENAATRKGDEMARQRILKEATPNLKLPQKSYYNAHPEDRYLDQVHEINKESRKIKNSQNSKDAALRFLMSPPPPTPPKSPPPPQPRTRFLIDQGDAVSDSQTGEIMWKQGDAVVDKTGKLIWIY
jgi:hypothetical protein